MYYLVVLFSALVIINQLAKFRVGNIDFRLISLFLVSILTFWLFLLSSFKGPIEPDYYSYRDIYYLAPDLSYITVEAIKKSMVESYGIEPGIVLISSFLRYFDFEYQSLVVFFSISNICLTYFICKKFPSDIRYLCFVFFILIFFQSYFVQIRFASGVFFTILACLYFIDGSRFKAVFLFCMGLLFHNTASLFLVTLPFFYLLRKQIDKHCLFLPLLLLVAFIDIHLILKTIIENIFPRYSSYLAISDSFSGSPFLFYWRWCFYSFLIFLLSYKEKHLSKSASLYEVFFKFLLYLNLATWAVGYNFPIFYRVSWFFDAGLLYFVFSYSRSKYLIKKILCFIILYVLFFIRFNDSISDFDSFYFDWYIV